MGFEIRDYNTMDDWSLFLLMLSDNSLEEKKYIFTNFSERLNNMEEDIFLQMIRQLKFDDVMGLSDYICAKIKNFNVDQIEKTLYVNKQYHDISALSDYLCTKDWFIKDEKLSSFLMGYRLEKLLEKDQISKEELNKIGKSILKELKEDGHDVELSDLIFKNYLNIKNFYNLTNYIEKLVKKFFSPIFYGTFFTAPIYIVVTLNFIFTFCNLTSTLSISFISTFISASLIVSSDVFCFDTCFLLGTNIFSISAIKSPNIVRETVLSFPFFFCSS